MTIEDQITALLAKAEPLRLLDDIEAERQGLGVLVEQINVLRAKESNYNHFHVINSVDHLGAPASPELTLSRIETTEAFTALEEKRKPGRPKKVEAN